MAANGDGVVTAAKIKKRKSSTCLLCGKIFTSDGHLYRHQRAVHKVVPCTRGTMTCPAPGCKHRCNFLTELRDHLGKRHNYQNEREILQFHSINEFFLWKEEEEKSSKSQFVCRSGQRKLGNGCIKRYFLCHRSGEHISRSTGKRQIKTQGSCKIGKYCPAAIEMTDNHPGIRVAYYKTHFGHDANVAHLKLTKGQRLFIASKLEDGQTFEDLLKEVKTSAPADDINRLHLLTRKDLHNIKRDFKFPPMAEEPKASELLVEQQDATVENSDVAIDAECVTSSHNTVQNGINFIPIIVINPDSESDLAIKHLVHEKLSLLMHNISVNHLNGEVLELLNKKLDPLLEISKGKLPIARTVPNVHSNSCVRSNRNRAPSKEVPLKLNKCSSSTSTLFKNNVCVEKMQKSETSHTVKVEPKSELEIVIHTDFDHQYC